MIDGDNGGDGSLTIETVYPSFLTKESLHRLMYAGKAIRTIGNLVPMEVRNVCDLSEQCILSNSDLSATLVQYSPCGHRLPDFRPPSCPKSLAQESIRGSRSDICHYPRRVFGITAKCYYCNTHCCHCILDPMTYQRKKDHIAL